MVKERYYYYYQYAYKVRLNNLRKVIIFTSRSEKVYKFENFR